MGVARPPADAGPRRPPMRWSAAAITAAIAAAVMTLAAAPLAAEPTLSLEVSPQDTLIGLSQRLLTSPGAWPEVARLNRLPNPNRIQPGQRLELPLRLVRSIDLPAQVVSLEGEVQIDGQAARLGQTVQPAQSLSTGPQGSAVLQLADGSRLQLVPGSTAVLAEHRRFGRTEGVADASPAAARWFAATLRLISGSLEVLASKVQRARPLEVQTPTAVVGVRGTEYRVRHEPAQDADLTRVEVLEGAVQADPRRRPEAGTRLAAGQGAAVAPDAPPTVAPLPPAPALGDWPARFERPLVRIALPPGTGALRWQVAADERFERLIRNERVEPGGELRIAGLPDGRWFLRARQIDPQGIEGLDTVRPFVLKARPEPPAAAAPRPGAKLPVGEVQLAWAENIEAAAYRVQWSADPTFGSGVSMQDEVRGAALRLSLGEPGVVHWRAASVRPDGDVGPWGDVRSFELRPLPTPPQGGVSADGQGLSLNWTGRAEDLQQVELARDPAFEQVVARDELHRAEWALPLPEQPGAYYFRYRSVEPDGFTSPWSSTLKVEVPRDWRFLWLVAPLLLSL